jgi:methenyltetrahydromethanopterin cyclohydrolase
VLVLVAREDLSIRLKFELGNFCFAFCVESPVQPSLNLTVWNLADALAQRAAELKIQVHELANGARVIDCGCAMPGSLEAGRLLAEICMAGRGKVTFAPCQSELPAAVLVCVETDSPVSACMASQYAGWQISVGKFFAMGSGPMRAVANKEPLFGEFQLAETSDRVVGVLETSKLPSVEVCEKIAHDCQVEPHMVTLLCASTHSIAGTIQVVARSVETTLHKLHTLHFPLHTILSGYGSAPLPPIAHDFLTGMGRTNDAILYGGSVALWTQTDDVHITHVLEQVPSAASRDFGAPFGEIFRRYKQDFYQIDPLLFSPAQVAIYNMSSGKVHCSGKLHAEVLRQSFLQ